MGFVFTERDFVSIDWNVWSRSHNWYPYLSATAGGCESIHETIAQESF
jgi:hypothetical protein